MYWYYYRERGTASFAVFGMAAFLANKKEALNF